MSNDKPSRCPRPPAWIAQGTGINSYVVLVHAALSIGFWYLAQGHVLPAASQPIFLTAFAVFGALLYKLRRNTVERFGPRTNAFNSRRF